MQMEPIFAAVCMWGCCFTRFILKCSICCMTFIAQSPYTKFCSIPLYISFFISHLGFHIILLVVMSLSLSLHNQANPLHLMYKLCVLGLITTFDLSWGCSFWTQQIHSSCTLKLGGVSLSLKPHFSAI